MMRFAVKVKLEATRLSSAAQASLWPAKSEWIVEKLLKLHLKEKQVREQQKVLGELVTIFYL